MKQMPLYAMARGESRTERAGGWEDIGCSERAGRKRDGGRVESGKGEWGDPGEKYERGGETAGTLRRGRGQTS
jgi:hypothetical protein